TLKQRKPGFYGRGDHYNHSSYADLIISGLIGLRPRAGDTIEVNPTLPPGSWDWFCLDGVPYHGHTVSITWDREGVRFKKGLAVSADGRMVAQRNDLGRVTGRV
ncbi:MAG TPA: glycosyl hydrolase family 65 protein, partial [Bryobacteraceae bacterium]